jgi:cytochrome b subunit of formate dehydrogenase
MSTPNPYHRRFALSQRVEHAVMLASFITLAATGLPQKFAAAAWADAMIKFFGGIDNTRIIHRYAATALMLVAIYHLVAVVYRVVVRRVRMTMLPTLQDARDALQTFLYNIGLTKQRLQMGRYTFEEKVEYWSLVWGTVVMILTGFMMWNPIATARFFPGQFIPAAKAAHGGEALLAVMAIIIWHMWSVHLRKFNKSMWTGRLTEDEMLHEHPLELADIKAGVAERPVDAATLKKRQRTFFPMAGVFSVALLAGIYYFVTFEQTAITTLPPTPAVQVFVPQTPTPLPPTATPKPVGDLTWDGYVSTLFADKCSTCHGTAAGLSFATYKDALAGSKIGPVIVPGNATGSKLVVVQSEGGHPGQLNEEELARIKEWIDRGAPEQ